MEPFAPAGPVMTLRTSVAYTPPLGRSEEMSERRGLSPPSGPPGQARRLAYPHSFRTLLGAGPGADERGPRHGFRAGDHTWAISLPSYAPPGE
jgi:hypothetical protein